MKINPIGHLVKTNPIKANLRNPWLRKGIKVIETDISRVIIEQYAKRLTEHLENDVVIVGAGPAGLAASYYLVR